MRRVELEAFIKGFLLFFLSMGTLVSILLYSSYTKEISTLNDKLLDKMRICSFDLQCPEFSIDFADNNFSTYKLYKDGGVKAYFPILKSEKNLLLISLSKKQYQEEIISIRWGLIREFSIIYIIILFVSMLFSLYTLSPLRQSLRLTEEFIKDILHDFNTPLASLRLNSSMLKREIGENKKINRIENSIESVLSLQENLRCYLFDHEMQQQAFALKPFVEKLIDNLEKNYGKLTYQINIPKELKIKSNEKAFERILNNLLSNASKYNKDNGSVTIEYEDQKLIISDTGKGIQDTQRIFDRFYKEQDRGIGVGLHIVKKLCDELNIKIEVTSDLGKGSRFILTLPNSNQ